MTESPIGPTSSDVKPVGADSSSIPQIDPTELLTKAGKTAKGLFGSLGNRLGMFLGLDTVQGLKFGRLFAGVFEKHGQEGVEQMFLVGTASQTPEVEALSSDWPRPWLFSRALVGSLVIYGLFRVTFETFDNEKLIPGMQIIGSFAVPFSILIFYFEMNAPRNVSLYRVLRFLLLGGIMSLFVALLGFSTVGKGLTWAKASAAGPIEEVGKALALFFVARNVRYKWTLNGLLFGGIVGAGFAGFESAGYALDVLFAGGSGKDMVENMTQRALMSPGGHVVWTAIVGAALWRVKGDRPFTFSMVKDRRFWTAIALTTVLHGIWNSPLANVGGIYLVRVLLTVIAWMVLFMYLQDGLAQITDAKAAATASPKSDVPSPVESAETRAKNEGSTEPDR